MAEIRDAAQELTDMHVAIVGQSDVGKSMVLRCIANHCNAPLDPEAPHGGRPVVHDRSDTQGRGTTKTVVCYDGGVLGDRKLWLWDMPGIGDRDVTVQELLMNLEQTLRAPGSIDCRSLV